MTSGGQKVTSRRRSIELVDYDQRWPAMFDALQRTLERILADIVLEIHHIGSTSVPGLCAKPKIDVDIVLRSDAVISDAIGLLKAEGYTYHGDKYRDGMWAFTLGRGSHGERLYLCAPSTPMHLRRLLFRDHLRRHPDTAASYGALKRKLASETDNDWDYYTGGKSSFVAKIVRREAIERIESMSAGKGFICREVLTDLPAWFGIPEAVEAYVAASDELPMATCLAPDGSAIGFASLKAQTAFAIEIHVMGIRRAWHRCGIGRALVNEATQIALRKGAKFLTVKTIAPSKPDPNYAATRQFYEAVGFMPLEEFPTLWGKDNPCLLMLLPLIQEERSI